MDNLSCEFFKFETKGDVEQNWERGWHYKDGGNIHPLKVWYGGH